MTSSLRAARLAVLTIFFVNGATIASWVPHIPLVQEKLDLSEGLLGLALLGVAAGAVVSLTLSGWLIARFGSRAVTSVSTVAFCFSLPLPVLAPNLALLILALVFFGLCNGAMDVAMNTQAVAVEEHYSKSIMSSFHGFFSLGGAFWGRRGRLDFGEWRQFKASCCRRSPTLPHRGRVRAPLPLAEIRRKTRIPLRVPPLCYPKVRYSDLGCWRCVVFIGEGFDGGLERGLSTQELRLEHRPRRRRFRRLLADDGAWAFDG